MSAAGVRLASASGELKPPLGPGELEDRDRLRGSLLLELGLLRGPEESSGSALPVIPRGAPGTVRASGRAGALAGPRSRLTVRE
jgi:hypothetical protein